MIRDGADGWRPVYYETDILSRVPWARLDPAAAFDLTLRPQSGRGNMRFGLEEKVMQDDPEYAAESMQHAAE